MGIQMMPGYLALLWHPITARLGKSYNDIGLKVANHFVIHQFKSIRPPLLENVSHLRVELFVFSLPRFVLWENDFSQPVQQWDKWCVVCCKVIGNCRQKYCLHRHDAEFHPSQLLCVEVIPLVEPRNNSGFVRPVTMNAYPKQHPEE